ncbi:hypothetical protein BDZ97DRAFT_2081376 [Flammula alnicola]|nr:hypothetical protein BDZ97DRAFT_2081376 [Flammula alnicola]
MAQSYQGATPGLTFPSPGRWFAYALRRGSPILSRVTVLPKAPYPAMQPGARPITTNNGTHYSIVPCRVPCPSPREGWVCDRNPDRCRWSPQDPLRAAIRGAPKRLCTSLADLPTYKAERRSQMCQGRLTSAFRGITWTPDTPTTRRRPMTVVIVPAPCSDHTALAPYSEERMLGNNCCALQHGRQLTVQHSRAPHVAQRGLQWVAEGPQRTTAPTARPTADDLHSGTAARSPRSQAYGTCYVQESNPQPLRWCTATLKGNTVTAKPPRPGQLQAERPDLQTMQTYRTIIEARTPLEAAKDSSTGTTPARETEQDGDELSEAEMPPRSAVDTNSDSGLLGMDTFNFEPESGIESDPYAPAADEDDEEEGDPGFSDASVEQDKALKKKQRKKDKQQKDKLRADIQAHRKIVTPSYAPANAQGRMQEVKGSGKSAEISGLQKNWKERVQPPLPSSSIKPSASTKGSQQRPETHTSHPNAGGDFNNQNDSEGSQDQAPAPKKQQSSSKAKTQVNHQEGTTMSGIKLYSANNKKVFSKPGR